MIQIIGTMAVLTAVFAAIVIDQHKRHAHWIAIALACSGYFLAITLYLNSLGGIFNLIYWLLAAGR